jgi:F0F1-type ATP synthase membrane subunit c/vacuolar-type H+-ATPase subunit K
MDILSKSLQYRIRIFDNYNHLKTVNFKVMGQKYVTVIVDNPIFGEKTKMAFLIPPDVKPYNFGGKELEYNYDVREASPLSSIANICPNLILELNEDLEQLLPDQEHTVIPAEFTPFEEELKTPSTEEEESDEEESTVNENIEAAKEKIREVVKVTSDASNLIKVLAYLKLTNNNPDKKKIKDIFAICAKYPSLLYWIPDYLELNVPVRAIISAIPQYRVGVSSSYFAAQSASMISEKVLQRPKEKMGLETVILVIAIGIFGLLFGLILLKAFGRI